MMLEIWQGWRRKAGVVLLAVACGMAVCWGRSLVYHEGPIVQQGEHLSYSVMSHESLLFLMRHHDSRTGGGGRPLLQWQCDSLSPRASYVTDMPQLKWIWHLGEFGLRDNSQKTVRITVLVITYWLPTLLLTTLAASLLLPNPPRPPKPQPDQSFTHVANDENDRFTWMTPRQWHHKSALGIAQGKPDDQSRKP